ncbi:MAG: DNA primase [Nanoarchaeota archaeon]|nr:DNA primase [Nanoarchaeota archaeon]MBU4123894.1 DNA primase [Nanoarchaeota archaeon]
MGKLAQATSKYTIIIRFNADGTVEKPDVIGAVFGQTEGLLGPDMDLRELQKTGRVGRIDVDVSTTGGKASGLITIPSSLDASETALIAACMETIERVGPCNTRLNVEKIEDVRISKRKYVVERAKELLSKIFEEGLPETQELSEQIKEAVRTSEVSKYKGLPSGPNFESYESIIIVEGRADVVALLRNGIKNVIALEGTSVPKVMAEITRTKECTAFLDGDRGGQLILKELAATCEIDFVASAPEGKEVEELTKKEIFKALRERLPYHGEKPITSPVGTSNGFAKVETRVEDKKEIDYDAIVETQRSDVKETHERRRSIRVDTNKGEKYKEILSQLTGTKAAYYLTEDMEPIGKVPLKEVYNTIRESGASVLVIDGDVEQMMVDLCARNGIKTIVGLKSSRLRVPRNVSVITQEDLG